MANKVLYHKKFKHAEITVEKTNRKEKITSGIAWAIVLGIAIWYVTR
ncbi:hypothetical protein [Streptococcus sciuri]|uniref:Phage protein n=1 Tax=Streptococcus sciuri TaxID=2973939 RepID=A0ABT2F7H1_9STRE|nr:hypothetical protein [Streptococcus sciuri]MCS4488408.1 hypothetical protein [Streptococcus sciuri]